MTYKDVVCSGPVLQILDSLPDEPEKDEPDTVGSQGSSARYGSGILPRQTVVMLRCVCVWVSWRVDKHTFIYLSRSVSQHFFQSVLFMQMMMHGHMCVNAMLGVMSHQVPWRNEN